MQFSPYLHLFFLVHLVDFLFFAAVVVASHYCSLCSFRNILVPGYSNMDFEIGEVSLAAFELDLENGEVYKSLVKISREV
jgi:hypothetical protein